MRASFWDAMHASFEDDVFDPVGSDVHRAFARALGRHAGKARFACDYGCGTGRQLPRLAKRFERVVGLDFAPKLLDVARARTRALPNVELRQADLRRTVRGLRGVELGICVNAWIMPAHDDRARMLRSVRASLAPGGRLVLVIPSLEAALYANERLIEWNRRSGLRGRALFREGIAPTARAAADLLHGVIDLDGSRTKHFLCGEALATFADARFELLEQARVEYPWSAYFELPGGKPLRFLREPLPWDWLFVLRRPTRTQGATLSGRSKP